MHRWVSLALVLVFAVAGIGAESAHAQTPVGTSNCQQLIWNTVRPVLDTGNRFNPGGIYPVGYWPLTQPFGSSPNEAVYTGYPTQALYSSYAVPDWAQRNPGIYAGAYPQSGVLPGLYPPDLTSTMGTDPNPALTSAGILQRLQNDGTFDRLSPTEQADWMFRLASLQRDEINQRFTQASLQQNAENTMLNLRRAPIDLSLTMQDRARNWRDSYSLYASTLQNLVSTTCNNNTGGVPGVTPGAAINGVTGAGVGGGVGGGLGTVNFGNFPSLAACIAAGVGFANCSAMGLR